MGGTGKARNVGLLQLHGSYLGDAGGKVTGVGLLVDSYLVMVVIWGDGSDQLVGIQRIWHNGHTNLEEYCRKMAVFP